MAYFSVCMRLFDALMIKTFVVLILVSNCSFLYAQTLKTDVLVIGDGAGGVAAAIQCARSKVKTILAVKSFDLDVNGEKFVVFQNGNVSSGIWNEFRQHVKDQSSRPGKDTATNSTLFFEKTLAESILQKMTDTVKNLTINQNASPVSIKKDGDRWEVHFLANGKDLEIKARVVVDATAGGSVAEKAGARVKGLFDARVVNYQSITYRTTIAAGNEWPATRPADDKVYSFWSFPVSSVLANGTDNLLITEGLLPAGEGIEYLPVKMELGQGAGVVAAYCAFFKTTTKNLKIRSIQGELLDFKGCLLPFADIPQKDRDWRPIQQVCATGLLKGENTQAGLMFMPDQPVVTADIRTALTEIYSRAFLWLNKEKPGEKFTIGNTLSLISDYTLTDPLVLNARVKSDWKSRYKFKLDFNEKRQITRREFAVLVNRYLNPFARTVDLEGRLVN